MQPQGCPDENVIALRLFFHSSEDLMGFSFMFHSSMNFISDLNGECIKIDTNEKVCLYKMNVDSLLENNECILISLTSDWPKKTD